MPPGDPGPGISENPPKCQPGKSNSFAAIGSTMFCNKQSNIFNFVLASSFVPQGSLGKPQAVCVSCALSRRQPPKQPHNHSSILFQIKSHAFACSREKGLMDCVWNHVPGSRRPIRKADGITHPPCCRRHSREAFHSRRKFFNALNFPFFFFLFPSPAPDFCISNCRLTQLF